MNRDDQLIKSVIEHLFDDLLRFFFDNADEIFDFSKGFEFLEQELDQIDPPKNNGEQHTRRYVDKLIKVYKKDGTEEFILIHIEAQGYKDANFPQRMYQYYARIWDKYLRPITALAIYTDSHPNYEPNTYTQHCLGTTLQYTYNTYKVLTQPEEALLRSNNPFAIVILAIKASLNGKTQNDDQLFKHKWTLVKHLLRKDMPREKIGFVMEFIRYFVRFENQEMNRKFEKSVAKIVNNDRVTMGTREYLLNKAENKGIEKGIDLGVEKGRNLGREETVSSILLTRKFSNAEIAEMVNAPISFVEAVWAKLNEKK